MKKNVTLVIAAHLATAIITLLTVRWYTHWYILPAARQSAFIDHVKSERELVEYLDVRYCFRSDASEREHGQK